MGCVLLKKILAIVHILASAYQNFKNKIYKDRKIKFTVSVQLFLTKSLFIREKNVEDKIWATAMVTYWCKALKTKTVKLFYV